MVCVKLFSVIVEVFVSDNVDCSSFMVFVIDEVSTRGWKGDG